MLSKSQLKLISSLQQKKYRTKHGLFIAEGVKLVNEFLNSTYNCKLLLKTEDFGPIPANVDQQLIEPRELQKISLLKSPNKVLGLFEIPEPNNRVENGLIVALDGLNDPGNLGTIIRLCDWFGVNQLVCSTDTVDCYNPKVVQASMGSLSRVRLIYQDLRLFLENSKLPGYGAFMDGDSVYSKKLVEDAILVMGNEANGISEPIASILKERISIPRFGSLQETESLNVASATAILLNEFRRG